MAARSGSPLDPEWIGIQESRHSCVDLLGLAILSVQDFSLSAYTITPIVRSARIPKAVYNETSLTRPSPVLSSEVSRKMIQVSDYQTRRLSVADTTFI
jgi:hypothetical protein